MSMTESEVVRMTENEAVEMFRKLLDVPCEMIVEYDSVLTKDKYRELVKIRCAEEMAISALEEVQQYRAIGTVKGYERAIQISIENYNLCREYKAKVQEFEAIGTVSEFRELKEKATAKKPIHNGHGVYFCPKCHGTVWQIPSESHYCFRCGTAFDWNKGKE